MTKSIIIFDLETNGLKGASVLSISAVKANYRAETDSFDIDESYNRFYFRNKGEALNHKALEINGLTDEVIKERRNKADYPERFIEDINSFKQFCKGSALYIAHNISFDSAFIPFIQSSSHTFCTMLNNTFINKTGKWPTLKATAQYYNIPVDNNKLHDGQYDASLCFEIIKSMYSNSHRELLEVLRSRGALG